MEIKDLAGLSKPLTRLIEVISEGIGAVSRPYLIRRDAAARADEIKLIAGALDEVAKKHEIPVVYKDGEIEVWQKPEDGTLLLEASNSSSRTLSRVDFQERKRQANIENVTSVAAAVLAAADDVPVEKPDEDWVTRFFDAAQDISSEQMQDLWGRVLAGEIMRPGTYSLRALDFMRNLTLEDAEALQKIGNFVVKSMDTAFVVVQDKMWLQKERDIYPLSHFKLGEIGLMYPTDLTLRFFMTDVDEEAFTSSDLILHVVRGDIKSEVSIAIWKLTNLGAELINLATCSPDEEYLELIGKLFVVKGAKVTLGKINEWLPDGNKNYNMIRVIKNVEPETTTMV